MTSRDPSVTLRSPRSTDPMYVLWRPHRSANSSWDKPLLLRCHRKFLDRMWINLRLGLRNLLGDTLLDVVMCVVSIKDAYRSTDYE